MRQVFLSAQLETTKALKAESRGSQSMVGEMQDVVECAGATQDVVVVTASV